MGNTMKRSCVDKSEEDYRICKPWLEDKNITKWLSSVLRFGKYYKIIHEMLISNKKSNLFFIYAEDKPVGLAGLMNIDLMDKRAEVWYLLGSKSDRNKNIATKAVNLLKDVAVQELKLFTLYAYVTKSNVASTRVLGKNGFKYVGKFSNAFRLNDLFEDLLIFDWIKTV